MDNEGRRRSGRVRTTVKTFQSEQEQAAPTLPIRKKSTKVKVKSENAVGTLVKDESIIKDEPDVNSTAANFQPINAGAAAESPVEVRPGKKRARAADLDDFNGEDESEVEEKPKKKKRVKKSSTSTGQLYGAPPAGTLIP